MVEVHREQEELLKQQQQQANSEEDELQTDELIPLEGKTNHRGACNIAMNKSAKCIYTKQRRTFSCELLIRTISWYTLHFISPLPCRVSTGHQWCIHIPPSSATGHERYKEGRLYSRESEGHSEEQECSGTSIDW